MPIFSFNSMCLHPYSVKTARIVVAFKNGVLWGKKRAAIATVYNQYSHFKYQSQPTGKSTSSVLYFDLTVTEMNLIQEALQNRFCSCTAETLTGNNLLLESCVACKLVSVCLLLLLLFIKRHLRPSVQLWGKT